MKKTVSLSIAIPGLILALAACEGVEPELVITEQEILEAYFSSIAPGLDVSEEALNIVAPGSPADVYSAEFLERLNRAEADGLIDSVAISLSFNYLEVPIAESEENAQVEEEADPVLEDVSFCFDQSIYPDANRENFCFVYTNFVFEEDQLVSFDANGNPIAGQVLLQYFGKHALARPEEKEEALAFAASGSDAEMYILQQSQATQAQLDGGSFDASSNDILFEGDVILACRGDYMKPDINRDNYCSEYSNFEFEADKLSTFFAGTSSLDGRLGLGAGEAIDIGNFGTITLLSSYVTIAGDLWVTAEVSSSTELLNISGWDSAYLGANGRQVASSGTWGPSELREGRVGNVAYTFAGAARGGEIELRFTNQNWREVSLSIPVP